MRISTAQLFQQGMRGMNARQYSVSELIQKISSGQKYLRASEDPFASARSLDLDQVVNRTAQYQENISFAKSSIALQETVMTGLTNQLQRVRELAIQANNNSNNYTDRLSIATEIRERLDAAKQLANTIGPDGDYLYAGHQGGVKPFESNAIGEMPFVSYQGDQGTRFIQIAEQRQIQSRESGARVFSRVASSSGINTEMPVSNTGTAQTAPAYVFDATAVTGDNYRIQFTGAASYDIVNETTAATIVSGATYAPGQTIEFAGMRTAVSGAPAIGDVIQFSPAGHQDVFATLGKMIGLLETPTTNDAFAAGMAETITDVDLALDHVLTQQSHLGGRLNALDDQADENAAYQLQTKESLSDLRDLDYAEAISQLQQEQFSLQAAQASFAKIQGLSLFNYI